MMIIANERPQEPVIVIRYLWDNVIDCAMCDKKIAYTQAGPNYGVPLDYAIYKAKRKCR